MTLEERIRHAMKLREISGRELARRAGLEDTQVNALLSRLKKNPDMDVSADILGKIADGAEVSFGWLVRERGPIEPSANDDAQPEAPPPASAGSASRYDQLPNWGPLKRAVMRRPKMAGTPPWVWRQIERANPLLRAPLTVGQLERLVEFVLENEVPPEGET